MSPNLRLAQESLSALKHLGVRQLVFCGGARNAPLATVLSHLQDGDGTDLAYFEVLSHFDERGAAFFALGLCRASEVPVAVITTSGTAVAECLPAVIEAHYQGLPLIILSADRPKRFRGSGAPQAIEQVNLLGSYVAFCADVDDPPQLEILESWQRNTPLHLNLCLEEPKALPQPAPEFCLSTPHWQAASAQTSEDELLQASIQLSQVLNSCADGQLLVLVGDLPARDRPAVADFLQRLQAPFWAEGCSGLREIKELQAVRLNEIPPKAAGVEQILRFGAVPSCRFWRDLENQPQLPVLSLNPTGYTGLARSSELIRQHPSELLPRCGVRRQGRAVELLRQGKQLSQNLEKRLELEPESELSWMRRLSEAIPSNALVYLGNSLPIREWNLVASQRPAHPNAYASRGANGIDGQIATFLGLAQSLPENQEAWAILGDLTTLYDINSLLLVEKLPRKQPLRLVVMNNHGGKIFRQLPVLHEQSPSLELIENSHQQNFAGWARAAGWKAHRWEHGEPLPEKLPARLLIEIEPMADS